MAAATAPSVVSLGGLLFRHRGWIPVPLAITALLPEPAFRWPALACLVAGEGLRLWAVGHIGRRSRTRGDDVGALVDTGPYAMLRNPLYVGNALLWAAVGGFAWPAALLLVPAIVLHYAFIVRWEEANLLAQLGTPYADYCRRVSRWIPRTAPSGGSWSAREAFRSERGTFAVIALAGALLAARWYLSR
ncbi:MAG: isoprenylcysteine carboxylmethyltransferase family protein [Deltaproteobacteria bacterium]|nr:isoprenylcysteine carboxylmethyltransferase family protein [Deltaproteobacteria bacterium]